MADKGVGQSGSARPRPATGRQRIRTLTQAALNADVTVEMVETILTDLGGTLTVLDKTTVGLDETMDRFNETITRIDELAPRLFAMVDRLEAIVERVERIVGVGESVVAPWAATENVVRGAVSAIRKSTGL
jgi:hypothetical protein